MAVGRSIPAGGMAASVGRASRRRKERIAARKAEADVGSAANPNRHDAADAPAWRRTAFLSYSLAVLLLCSFALTALPRRWAGPGAAAAYAAVTIAAALYRARREGLQAAAQAGRWLLAIWAGGVVVYLSLQTHRLSLTAEGILTGVTLGLMLSLSARILFPPPLPASSTPPKRPRRP